MPQALPSARVRFVFVLQSLNPSGREEDVLTSRLSLLIDIWGWHLSVGMRPAAGNLCGISQLCLRGAARRFAHPQGLICLVLQEDLWSACWLQGVVTGVLVWDAHEYVL